MPSVDVRAAAAGGGSDEEAAREGQRGSGGSEGSAAAEGPLYPKGAYFIGAAPAPRRRPRSRPLSPRVTRDALYTSVCLLAWHEGFLAI